MKARPVQRRSSHPPLEVAGAASAVPYAPLHEPRWYGVRDNEAEIALDIDESATDYMVRADLPGARREDIDVSIDEATLTISAAVNAVQVEQHDLTPLVRERWQGRRSRRVLLDCAVDATHSSAKFVDGVLELRLPKKPGGRGRRVKIG